MRSCARCTIQKPPEGWILHKQYLYCRFCYDNANGRPVPYNYSGRVATPSPISGTEQKIIKAIITSGSIKAAAIKLGKSYASVRVSLNNAEKKLQGEIFERDGTWITGRPTHFIKHMYPEIIPSARQRTGSAV